MTNLSTVLERIAKAKTAKTATQTATKAHEKNRKTAQAEILEIQQTEQVEQELIFDKFPVITNFFESLEGAKRLYKYAKKMQEVNTGGYLTFQKADEDDFISEIYATMLDYEPKDTDEPLTENLQKWYGIQTKEQRKAARNAFDRYFYKMTIKAPTSQYDQNYGLNGTHSETEQQSTSRDIEEKELEIILKEILTDRQYAIIQLTLQGYKQTEIMQELGVSKMTITRDKKEATETIAIGLDFQA